jgi:hypothetical protein
MVKVVAQTGLTASNKIKPHEIPSILIVIPSTLEFEAESDFF